MTESLDLKQLERRTCLSYQQDRLLAILIGLCVLAFSASRALGAPLHRLHPAAALIPQAVLVLTCGLAHSSVSPKPPPRLPRRPKVSDSKPKPAGLPPLSDIDRLVHEPARLMIMACLYVVESAGFLFVMRQTRLTHGNLSSHMKKLEAAGYIEVRKEFVDRKPHTLLRLTDKGRAALQSYRRQIQQVFEELPD